MARTVTNLTAVLQMNNTRFKKGLSSSQKALNVFRNQVQAIGGMVAGAFAVGSIVNFGREAVRLAGQAEGIRAAFQRLNDPQLLDNLKMATRDTVSELELMKAAVRAENFKVPLEQLATFFQFATDRAIQTGESVDYLVNSIIDGIGRKSTLVMDNLGISAAELQKEIKLVGDFGKAAANIIEREMGKAGAVMDTTAIKAAQLRARFENLKETTGRALIAAVIAVSDSFMLRFNPAQYAAEMAVRDTNEALAKQKELLDGISQNAGILNKSLTMSSDLSTALATRYRGEAHDPFKGPDFRQQAWQLGQGAQMGGEGRMPWDYLWQDDTEEIFEEGVDAVVEKWREGATQLNMTTQNVGKSVGVMLVSQFDSLGEAIGRSIAGADDSLQNLGQTITQNMGNLLMMLGFQTGNIPLAILGAGLQLGSGIFRGLGSSAANGNAGRNGNIEFRQRGRDLVGVANVQRDYLNQVT